MTGVILDSTAQIDTIATATVSGRTFAVVGGGDNVRVWELTV